MLVIRPDRLICAGSLLLDAWVRPVRGRAYRQLDKVIRARIGFSVTRLGGLVRGISRGAWSESLEPSNHRLTSPNKTPRVNGMRMSKVLSSPPIQKLERHSGYLFDAALSGWMPTRSSLATGRAESSPSPVDEPKPWQQRSPWLPYIGSGSPGSSQTRPACRWQPFGGLPP